MVDELWSGGPRFLKSKAAFAIGTDAVLLADFVNTLGAGLACDLGCGSALISVLMALKNPKLIIDGLEIQKEAASVAGVNVEMNRLSSRIRITTGDIRECDEFYDAGEYDIVVSNPPYFASGSGYVSPDESTAKARDERDCTLDDVCRAAGFLTRWGGKFALVHRPERLSEVFVCMTKYGLEPKRMRFVQHKAGSAPNIVLVEARRGGKPSLVIEPPLIMTNPDGSDSDEIIRIYHREEK